jgi:hypothetical protein
VLVRRRSEVQALLRGAGDARSGRREGLTVPVEVTERALRDALALAGEHGGDDASAARAALAWMGWEDEGSLWLRRYDVQLFVWYTLPRKFLASLEDKRAAAAGLARTLDRLGERAASYAEVCRSLETDELLCAWEAEDPAAWQRLRELLDRSGIEPPDTDLLAWGQVMGLAEASVRQQVETALEEAIENGRLAPSSPGFRRRQVEVTKTALLEPWDGADDRSRLDAVHAERLERWLDRGHTRGSAERRSILAPVAEILAADARPVEAETVRDAVAPVLWLLDRAGDGIALTQTGALNRALVREAAERWPAWWRAELFGSPSREEDVTPLHELHGLLRRVRLVRRTGRRIVVTARGRALQRDPPALLEALTRELLAGESFRAACAELAVALMLDGIRADYGDDLAGRIQPAIVAEGWQADGETPGVRDIGWSIAEFLRPAEAIGILSRGASSSRRSRDPVVLTDPGRTALNAALRARALAPATRP